MDLLDKMNRVAFLGPEFLTWLWYRTETVGEIFNSKVLDGHIEVWFDDRLVVGSTMVNAQQNFFKGGHPPTSLEARTALRLGKLATEAKLRIIAGTREWSFVLKASTMELSGVKVPAVLSKEDDDRIYERFFLLEQLDGIVKELFAMFLKKRLSPSWQRDELLAIQEWVGASAVAQGAPSETIRQGQSIVTEQAEMDGGSNQKRDSAESPRNEDLPPWEDPIGGPVD